MSEGVSKAKVIGMSVVIFTAAFTGWASAGGNAEAPPAKVIQGEPYAITYTQRVPVPVNNKETVPASCARILDLTVELGKVSEDLARQQGKTGQLLDSIAKNAYLRDGKTTSQLEGDQIEINNKLLADINAVGKINMQIGNSQEACDAAQGK